MPRSSDRSSVYPNVIRDWTSNLSVTTGSTILDWTELGHLYEWIQVEMKVIGGVDNAVLSVQLSEDQTTDSFPDELEVTAQKTGRLRLADPLPLYLKVTARGVSPGFNAATVSIRVVGKARPIRLF